MCTKIDFDWSQFKKVGVASSQFLWVCFLCCGYLGQWYCFMKFWGKCEILCFFNIRNLWNLLTWMLKCPLILHNFQRNSRQYMFSDYEDVNFNARVSLLKWCTIFENSVIREYRKLVFFSKNKFSYSKKVLWRSITA